MVIKGQNEFTPLVLIVPPNHAIGVVTGGVGVCWQMASNDASPENAKGVGEGIANMPVTPFVFVTDRHVKLHAANTTRVRIKNHEPYVNEQVFPAPETPMIKIANNRICIFL